MPGSNNFLTFNEVLNNIETDANYAIDTARINGVTTGIASSLLNNKLSRQTSVMVAAIAQFVANTGNSVSDLSLTNLIIALTKAIASKNDLNTWALNKPVADTGIANGYVIATGFAYNALYNGMVIKFIASHANTGACTINPDNLGNVSLVKNSSTPLVAGDMILNQIITAIYDGIAFEIVPDYSILATSASNALTLHVNDNTKHIASVTTTNTGNAYVATIPNLANLIVGIPILIKFNAANTGAATLNVNNGGTVPLVKDGNVALVTGDILINFSSYATYDGTNIQITPSYAYKLNVASAALTLQLHGMHIFSELTDPVGIGGYVVTDKDVWNNMTNGLTYIRISGAWSPQGAVYK